MMGEAAMSPKMAAIFTMLTKASAGVTKTRRPT